MNNILFLNACLHSKKQIQVDETGQFTNRRKLIEYFNNNSRMLTSYFLYNGRSTLWNVVLLKSVNVGVVKSRPNSHFLITFPRRES